MSSVVSNKDSTAESTNPPTSSSTAKAEESARALAIMATKKPDQMTQEERAIVKNYNYEKGTL